MLRTTINNQNYRADPITITTNEKEKVYSITILTPTFEIKSSKTHKWLVWNKTKKDFELIHATKLNEDIHELLVCE